MDRRRARGLFRGGRARVLADRPRGNELLFQIHSRGAGAFIAVERDAESFQRSDVLSAWFCLERGRHQRGHWVYRLLLK